MTFTKIRAVKSILLRRGVLSTFILYMGEILNSRYIHNVVLNLRISRKSAKWKLLLLCAYRMGVPQNRRDFLKVKNALKPVYCVTEHRTCCFRSCNFHLTTHSKQSERNSQHNGCRSVLYNMSLK